MRFVVCGEALIDLMPEGWKGPPPSLPQEVVKELAERARAAERALRAQRAAAESKKRPPIRVRASMQPTFVRFVFEMPDGVGVSSVLNEQKLTLAFNASLLRGEKVLFNATNTVAKEDTALYVLVVNESSAGAVGAEWRARMRANHHLTMEGGHYHGPYSDGNEMGVEGWMAVAATAGPTDRRPVGPTASAAGVSTAPRPVPRSRTRSPSVSPASSTSRRPKVVKKSTPTRS